MGKCPQDRRDWTRKRWGKRGPAYDPRRSFESIDGSELTADDIEFMMAMDRYKREMGRPFPDCADVLAVAKSLGYRRVE